MPERSALVAVLILERPLCVACLVGKSGLSREQVMHYLGLMRKTLDVKHGDDRCRACGIHGPVYSLVRIE